MNAADSQRLLQHIRRLAGDPAGMPSDSELLRRYLERRDESAFAALIRRHGSMVYSVCQSVLRQGHDAEDAFQAAFLVLAQKASSIRRQEGLGGWLQRVAYRIALKLRKDNLRRQKREAKTARSPVEEPSGDELSWRELRSILHTELAALPERFRAPLVLCYLEGLTQEETGRRLGWTAATVKGRLQRGREKLRRRLERRGVALTTALAAALTGQALAANAVPSLTMTTAATALAHGFLRPLLSIKLALLTAVLLSLGVVAGGVALRSPSEPRPSESGEPPDRSLTVAAQKEDAHGDPLPEGAVARLGTVRFNHGDGLHSLFFSPDGKTIISEGNGSICFWDADNGKELHRIPTDKISYAFLRPTLLADGKTLVIQGARGSPTFWDLAAKKRIRTQELRDNDFPGPVVSLSPDGKLCVLHADPPAPVQVSDLTTGKSLYRLANSAKTFLAVAFAGNDHLVSADGKNRLEVWEARTGKFLRRLPHDAPIRYLLASPDGRWLAGLDQRPSVFGRNVEQETVYLWDMKTGKATHSFRAKPKRQFTNICFSPDGKSLLTSTQHPFDVREVVLWDRETGRRLLTFDAASGIYADIAAISPDGSRLAAAAGTGGYASKFELWDLKNGHRLTSEDGRHLYWLPSVVLAPAGDRATILNHDSISCWDATSGRRLHSFDLPRDTLDSLSLSSDGRYAVTCRLEEEEFQVLIWDISARKILHTLRLPGGYQHITSTFAPDSSLLATSSLLAISQPGKPTLVRLWDVRRGKQVRSFEVNKEGWAGQLQFTADGKTLFVADQRVAAYEVASGKELFSWRLKPVPNTSAMRDMIQGVKLEQIGWCSLAVSSDGARVAAVLVEADNVLRRGRLENRLALYDGHSGKLLRRWDDSGLPTPYFEKMAFSPDGQLLASSDVRAVHLWETATTELIRTFQGHQADVCAVAFSRDGRRLASADKEGSTVLIWDVTGQPAKATALTEAKLKECWNDLAAEDAGRAHRAVWTLIAAPRESVPFLKARLHPIEPVNREQLDRWIRALDADTFEAREKASAELENLGELAEPVLRRVLENKPTLEQRRRIEPILAKLEAAIPSGEMLRSLRAVRVLEHAGTPEAQRLLRELANGAAEASLTRAAQAALKRQ